MGDVGEVVDLLARPVYGMAQVDAALGLRTGTARRWIDGYERGGRTYTPIVRLETTGDDLVTWGEFVETRALAEYRDVERVPIIRLRPVVDRLREEYGWMYPLAHARPWLEPDGNELVARIQEEVGLERPLQFFVYRSGQLTLAPPAKRFVESVEFGDVAERIRPDAELDVFIDPVRQFGAPVVRSVPTEVIVEQYEAGDSPETIAALYELDQRLVHHAIRYELRRRDRTSLAA